MLCNCGKMLTRHIARFEHIRTVEIGFRELGEGIELDEAEAATMSVYHLEGSVER